MNYLKVVIVSLMVLNLVEFVLCQSNKIPTTIGTITAQPSTTIPDKLAVPKGNNFAFLLNARGNQRYKCIAPTVPGQPPGSGFWSNGDSDAVLINDKSDTNQNFIPSFEVVHFNISLTPSDGGNYTWNSVLPGDNSGVVGKLVDSVNSTDGTNIPWEIVAVTSRKEPGRLSNISYILKVNTAGGVAPPANQCGIQYQNDFILNVTFDADYWFYEGPLPNKTESSQPAATPSIKSNGITSIGPQFGWVAIVGFVSVGVVFF